MHSKFQIFKSTKNNQFYFRLRASNNKIILASEGYTTKGNCKNGIESTRIHSPHDTYYKRLLASNEQYYFTLTAANNQVIGTSEMYLTNQAMNNGIESVKANAPTALIEDLTLNMTYS
ncbi:MAG: hypothetical protein ACJAW8_002038 [Oleispira sp.]|jgi:uncharacterized protein YegP (UPF0339 family)